MDRIMRMIYVASKEQHADVLTKALDEEHFKCHWDVLMTERSNLMDDFIRMPRVI